MNQERNANYEDRIEFTIALMTKDYKKAHDIGNRLLKQNRNDVDIIRGLNILKHKKKEECERSSLINESTDNECEISNAVDGDATDFIDNNVDIRIDPEMPDKIMSHGTSLLNNKASLSQQRMYKVIPIKMNKKVTEV